MYEKERQQEQIQTQLKRSTALPSGTPLCSTYQIRHTRTSNDCYLKNISKYFRRVLLYSTPSPQFPNPSLIFAKLFFKLFIDDEEMTGMKNEIHHILLRT